MLWIVLIKKKVTEKKIPNISPVSERSSWFTQVHEQKRRKILILTHEVDSILCRGKTGKGILEPKREFESVISPDIPVSKYAKKV
jgi:hypothetical protein